MATFFLDPESGNDANDGTTFALRKKTLTSFSAAILAPGDTIRCIASRTPASPGNATFTNASRTVTLAAAQTANIATCDSVWTAAANVTATASTTRKEGTNSASLAIAAGFTTGKIAHFATGTLNLSSYQTVSFWIRPSTTLTLASFTLRLCSDTLGDVPVNTIALGGSCGTNLTLTANQWVPITVDTGGALGSAIASVSLAASVDPGTITVILDNIIAGPARSSPNFIGHDSLLGKNTAGEPEWYPIQSINGTTVVLGKYPYDVTTSATGLAEYTGASETVAYFVNQPLPGYANADRDTQEAGTLALRNTLSGGWNRTDMSTQTGESLLTGYNTTGNPFDVGDDYWTFTNFASTGFTSNSLPNPSSSAIDGLEINWNHASGTYACITFTSQAGMNFYNIGRITWPGGGTVGATAETGLQFSSNTTNFENVTVGRITGAGNKANATARAGIRVTGGPVVPRLSNLVKLGRIDNCSEGITCTSMFSGYGGTLDNNNAHLSVDTAIVQLHNTTFDGGTLLLSAGDINLGEVLLTSKNGDANLTEVYKGAFNVKSVVSPLHGSATRSVQMTLTNAMTPNVPALVSLARYAVVSGSTYAVTVWMQRSDANMTMGARIRAGMCSGVLDQVVTVAAAINTWESKTLTFTPAANGVVELEGFCYNTAASGTATWGDLSVI